MLYTQDIDFFLKEIELINEAVNSATYDIGENKSASMNNSLNQSQIFVDEDDTDADFEMSPPPVEEQKPTAKVTAKSPVVSTVEDEDDDLPF